ncbi:MAG: phosphohistidine phosphatase SixA [Chthoniobacterales bacterium]|nr:phosphohistidine phosphatase SixA [Chthoniobacterales bacterium]
MILYLLRHAEAEPHCNNDAERKLTVIGKTQALRVGKFCKKYNIKPDLVLTSPFCRAVETMHPVLEKIGMPPFLELAWIASGMIPEVAIEELQSYITLESVMLVGHEPDLSYLIAKLLGMAHSKNVNVPKASLTAIKVEKIAPGAGILQFLIPVEFVNGK